MAVVAVGVAFSATLIFQAFARNGTHGFPLDDAWIHLSYARVLAEHGEFAYFPGDPSTQGSTAPLYTLAVAAGMLLVDNEKLLSYALGLAGQGTFLALFVLWARRRLDSLPWALAAALLLAIDRRIGTLAAAGMETPWFLAAVAGVFAARAAGRQGLVSLALAAALWLRPDALILAAVVTVDQVLARTWSRAEGTGASPDANLAALLPGAAVAMAWFLFNRLLGGTWLPNTFAAKTAYYRNRPRGTFLREEVVGAFTVDAWMILTPLALVAVAICAWHLVGRKRATFALEVGWWVALPIAYVAMLPFAHRFDRYLLPALPAVALLGVAGLRQASSWLASLGREGALMSRALVVVGLVSALGLQVNAFGKATGEFTFYSAYHHDRHERTGRWLAENTPSDAVVATHDIGAIAFYSGRKVVDVVGLTLPEATVHLNTPGYPSYLSDLFSRSRVTHVAVLRNWLEVDNADAIFLAVAEPEYMEVFKWREGQTHLVETFVSGARAMAARTLRAGNFETAEAQAAQVVELDPRSARSWTLRGYAALRAGHGDEALSHFEKALDLHPGQINAQRGAEEANRAQSGESIGTEASTEP
ncbi:MAG: tetratricopeptide repeat protein [Acidobacteriota bacterium]|nr:tetratricopeptide repeat protein [Acidobacteriota bacterium]